MEIGVEMTAEMCTASIDKLAPLLVGHAMQMALNSSNVVGGNVYAAAKEEDAEGEPAREELSEQKEAQSLMATEATAGTTAKKRRRRRIIRNVLIMFVLSM